MLELRRLARRILRVRQAVVRGLNCRFTHRATGGTKILGANSFIENGLLSILIAVGTKPMRWLAHTHAFLQGVGSRTFPDRYQRIALLLSIPVFHAHDLRF